MVLALSYGVNLAITAVLTVFMQLAFFSLAYTLQIDKVTDLAGALNFLLNALLIFRLRGTFFTKQIMVVSLLSLWAVRLGVFLGMRVFVFGKDRRFDEMRGHFWQFFGFWIFQMAWVWLVSLPITAVNSSAQDPGPLTALDALGYVLFGLGWILESVADLQKFMFSLHRSSVGAGVRCTAGQGIGATPAERPSLASAPAMVPFIRTGLWRYSRHPNYCGEIFVWIGFWVMSITGYAPANVGIIFISLMSPLVTFLLLVFISGMPIAEESANKRYGRLDAYRGYRGATSPLWTLSPCLYKRCPSWLKHSLLLEWPLYERGLETSDRRRRPED